MRRLLIAAAFVTSYIWIGPPSRDRRGGRDDSRTDRAARPPRIRRGGEPFVVDAVALERLKFDPPAVIGHNPHLRRREFTVDVVSVGSNTRIHFLRAQEETWSSHSDIRNFWGFTESNDYDSNCTHSTNERMGDYMETCRSPYNSGWDSEIEKFSTHRYGETENGLRHEGGWVCAQRRVGRALGWVHHQYSNNDTMLPDVLAIVDDDTSLDIGNLKQMIIGGVGNFNGGHSNGPLVYAGCYYPKTPHLDVATTGWPFATPHGGFGTYFSKRAIRILVQPLFCDEGGSKSKGACVNLKENRISESVAFREGISILELFYRYSAVRHMCMHSDWLLGYMINYYLYPQRDLLDRSKQSAGKGAKSKILRVNPPLCGNVTDRLKIIHCTEEYATCHRQTPETMEHWAVAAFVRSPGSFCRVPHLKGTEFIMGNPIPKS